MKVSGHFYYDFVDIASIDPTNATTVMDVFVRKDDDDGTSNYIETYQFTVYTYKYFQERFVQANQPLMECYVLIVPTLDDDWMFDYLNANVENVRRIGEEH